MARGHPRRRCRDRCCRHFLNRRGAGGAREILDYLGLFGVLDQSEAAAAPRDVNDDKIMQIVKKRCVTCHSKNPTHTMFLNQPPPKDIAFDSIEEVRVLADRIMVQVVELKRMPLGNETAMENEERTAFATWIEAIC